MSRQTVDIPAAQLGDDLTAALDDKPDPAQKVRVMVEPVPDYADVPDDILESQRRGLRERMKPGDRASDAEVEAVFEKLS